MDDIQTQNSELFTAKQDINDLSQILLQALNDRKIRLFELSPHKRIFLFILTRVMKTCSAVDMLCKNGYGQDAAALMLKGAY